METAFQQRRQSIVGDCKQLKNDLDSYNENFNTAVPIQIILTCLAALQTAQAPEGNGGRVGHIPSVPEPRRKARAGDFKLTHYPGSPRGVKKNPIYGSDAGARDRSASTIFPRSSSGFKSEDFCK